MLFYLGQQNTYSICAVEVRLALLRKSGDGRSFPFPGQTYPARCVQGVPRAVKRLRMTALI